MGGARVGERRFFGGCGNNWRCRDLPLRKCRKWNARVIVEVIGE